MSPVLGVDGCPGGWIGAVVSADGVVEWRLFADARAIVATLPRAVGIDIPIGLPDDGPRGYDLAARRLLGPRRATVFPAPCGRCSQRGRTGGPARGPGRRVGARSPYRRGI